MWFWLRGRAGGYGGSQVSMPGLRPINTYAQLRARMPLLLTTCCARAAADCRRKDGSFAIPAFSGCPACCTSHYPPSFAQPPLAAPAPRLSPCPATKAWGQVHSVLFSARHRQQAGRAHRQVTQQRRGMQASITTWWCKRHMNVQRSEEACMVGPCGLLGASGCWPHIAVYTMQTNPLHNKGAHPARVHDIPH